MAGILVKNTGQVIETSAAISVLNSLMRNGVQIKHVCGGKAQCGTCRYKVLKGAEFLSPIRPSERIRLDALGNPENVRLGCQSYTFGDIEIEILLSD